MRNKNLKRLISTVIKLMDIFSCKKHLVLGDSHARIFKDYRFKMHFPFTSFDVCNVEGATVSGLENPNSKTNALKIFREKLKKGKSSKKIIFLIGEVDTGFVIWYRAEKHNSSVDAMLNLALSNYYNLLSEALEFGDLLVISTPLPTIGDDNDWGEVAGLRKEVRASQLERTQLTLLFNRNVESFCLKNKIGYLNLDKESLGPNGVVEKKLINSDKNDHHYKASTYANLIVHRISVIFKNT